MAQTLDQTSSRSKSRVYANQIAELRDLRQQFALNLQSQGAFTVSTQRVTSSITNFNKSVTQQKASLRDIIGMRKQLVAAYREQVALNNSMAAGFTSNSPGRSVVDLVTARSVNREMSNFNTAAGYANTLLRSASIQALNWGKNLQWTGRQISIGIGVPLALAAAATGKLAYETDRQLTRLQRVYNTTADQYSSNVGVQMQAEAELSQVRESALNNAIKLAKEYGVAVNDTLTVQANLGAAGFAGPDLQAMTTEVQRIARLGELTTETSTDLAVTLGNAFKMSKDELTEFNDFANAVENSTSLSINDIAEALPRAGSAFAAAGVPAKNMVALLVAMKQNGVDAAEGANALKSSTASLLSPTRRAIKTFDDLNAKYQTNIDISTIMARNKGNTFEVIKELGNAMKDFDAVDKQKGTANLFGTYQFNRMTAVLQNVGEAFDETGKAANQTGIAMELAMEDPAKLAAISAKEMETAMNSASGKFKAYVEGIKGEMSRLGQPVLAAINPVLGVIEKMITAFNGLPGPIKSVSLILAAIGLAIGPLIMLTGVFVQLFANVGRGVSTLLGLAYGFKGMTAEQVASRLATNNVTAAFNTEAAATARLNDQIMSLTSSTNLLLAAQNKTAAAAARTTSSTVAPLAGGAAAGAAAGSSTAIISSPGALRPRNGSRHSAGDTERAARNTAEASQTNAATTRRAALDAERQAAASARTASNLRMGAASSVALAAGMGLTMLSSNEVANSIGNVLITAGLLATVLTAIPFKAMATSLALAATSVASRMLTGARGAVGSFGKIVALAKGLGPALGFVGILAAVAGVAYGIKKWYDWANKARKEAEAMANATESLAEAAGVNYTPRAFTVAPDGSQVDNIEEYQKATAKLKEDNEEIYNMYQRMGNNTSMLTTMALNEGSKIIAAGGTLEEAQKVMKTLLYASGQSAVEIDKIMLDIKDFDLADPAAAAANLNNLINQQVIASISNDNKKDPWYKRIFRNKELTEEAESAAIMAGQKFAEKLNMTPAIEQGNIFEGFDKQVEGETQGIIDNINKQLTAGKQGIKFGGPAQFIAALRKEYDRLQASQDGAGSSLGSFNNKQAANIAQSKFGINVTANQIKALEQQAAREKSMAQALAAKYPEQIKDIKNVTSLEQVAHELNIQYKVSQGANEKNARAVEESTEALAEQEEQMQANKEQADIYVQALKSTYSNTMDDVYSAIDKQLDSLDKAAMDALQAQGESKLAGIEAEGDRISDSFDARIEAQKEDTDRLKDELKASQKADTKAYEDNWKKILEDHDKYWKDRKQAETDAFDARIKGVEDSIDAEQRAEEIRQRIFDAEQRRVERMARAFTANADFNVALNAGNLDEASRVFNSAESQRQQWNIDDQKEGQGTASEKKIKALEAEKEAIEADKEARLKIIDELEDADKKAFEARKDREDELLSIKQENDQKALDSNRDALDKQLANDKESASKLIAVRKAMQEQSNQVAQAGLTKQQEAYRLMLDGNLRAFKAYIPQDETELNNHINAVFGAVEAANPEFANHAAAIGGMINDSLTQNGNAAAQSIANDAAWAAVGDSIMAGIATGVGLNEADLINFLKTGIWPNSTAQPAKASTAAPTIQTKVVRPAAAFYKTKTTSFVNGISAPTKSYQGVPSTSKRQSLARHTGGPIGFSSKDRTGVPRSASLYPSEVSTVLKKGEFVVNQKATRENFATLQQINSRHQGGVVGEAARHTGGPMGSMQGMGASIGGAIAKAIGNRMTTLVTNLANTAKGVMPGGEGGGTYGMATPGKFGTSNFNAEQLKNANTIMNVGKSMGASQRDITIALMTAMQESTLKNLNYGDRDSVGLFQQRTSQGWGSVAQIMDPNYSAKKFYEELFKVKSRDSMSLNDAAQKVQRSGFPNAYAKWQDEAEAIIRGSVQAAAETGAVTSGTSANGIMARPANMVYLQLSDLANLGPAHRITSTTGGTHAKGSYHYKGQAVDIGGPKPGVNTPELLAINQFFAKYGNGLSELIYGGTGGINLYNGKPHAYSAATLAAHRNHVHVAASPAMMKNIGIPGLKVGGTVKYDNTLANLHKDERILTAPLSAKLDEGIERFATGGSSSVYDIKIDLSNASGVSETDRALLKKAVYEAIDEREDRRGKGRTVK